MIISCVKWGDKFSHEHVNRLYRMVCKNFKEDFTFVCHTENPNNIHPDIKIAPLNLDYDLENWWWKLTLFENPTDEINMFLDLDIVIQNDITHLKDYAESNKLMMIYSYWKPYNIDREFPMFDTKINSSVLIWTGDLTNVWKYFSENIDYYTMKYNGIDSFLDYNHREKLIFLPKGEIYSRLYGIDDIRYWRAYCIDADEYWKHTPSYFYDSNHNICIFNGWRRKTLGYSTKYLLDEDGYNGLEHYWS